jgi:hypothetical protein
LREALAACLALHMCVWLPLAILNSVTALVPAAVMLVPTLVCDAAVVALARFVAR